MDDSDFNMKNDVEIKECFDFLYVNQKYLSASQVDLIRSMKRHYQKHKELSERQVTILKEIRKHLEVPESIRTINFK